MIKIIEGPNIEAGESLSDDLDLGAGQMVRITMPSDFSGSELTFQISTDGVFFNDLFDIDGREIKVMVVPGTGVIFSPDALISAVHLKFRAGTRDSPVVQPERRVFAVAVDQGSNLETIEPPPPLRKAKPAPKTTKKRK